MVCTRDGTGDPPLVTTAAGDESLTLAIVRAVAAVENQTPESLRPLGEVIDPEALEAVAAGGGPTRVTFSYAGYQVVVDDETVEIH